MGDQMPRKWIAVGSCTLALMILALFWASLGRANSALNLEKIAQPNSADEPPPERERQTAEQAPLISFIDSPSAACIRARPASRECFINWNYLSVTATSPQYIITMTVAIDGQMRAYYSGFFQTSMYVPFDMNPKGFKVACGDPGTNANPELGKTYSYTIRARESGGLGSANYGSVTCPVGAYSVYLPFYSR